MPSVAASSSTRFIASSTVVLPVLLGLSPADRDHRVARARVVHRLGHGLEEAARGVRREVHDDPCARCDRADGLDVAGDFAVVRGGVAVRVRCARHRPTSSESPASAAAARESTRACRCATISAAERDDGDGLAVAVEMFREAVEIRRLPARCTRSSAFGAAAAMAPRAGGD